MDDSSAALKSLNLYPKEVTASTAKKSTRLTAAQRLRRMHDQLVAAYGPQFWWPAQTAFEVIVGAYLTQNTSWKAVERSLENLRAAGAMSVEGLRAISLDELRRAIQPSGFFTRKAPALKAFIAMLDEEFGGSLDAMASAPTAELRKRLLELPGVGRETADAILLYALGHAVPVADEYLRRIADRHGLLRPAPGRARITYDALADLTRRAFVQDPAEDLSLLYNEFHALVVAVGKAHCGRVAKCEGCPLAEDREQGTEGPRDQGTKGTREKESKGKREQGKKRARELGNLRTCAG